MATAGTTADTAVKPARRNASDARPRILDAALAAFAQRGYANIGLRDIAKAAGADTTHIRRFFGSKEKLFEAVLEHAIDVTRLTATSRERFGEHVVQFLIERPTDRPITLPMLIFASADPVPRAIALRLIERRLVAPLSEWFGEPEGAKRAAKVMLLCTGIFFYARVLPISPLAPEVPADIRKWMADILQGVMDE